MNLNRKSNQSAGIEAAAWGTTFRISIITALLLLLIPGRSAASEFDTLRQYWWTNLIGASASPSNVDNTANDYWSTMNTNASRTKLWNDLPYGSSSYSIVATFLRLNAMALAWAKPGCSLQGNAKLASDVADGMDWMATNIYTPTASEYGNWFHWEDSGPQYFENAIVLLYPALTPSEISNYCASIDHFNPSGWMTGANMADKILIMAIRGIVGQNSAKISTARDQTSALFPFVTNGEGFYADGSYVFHTAMAYNGSYGVDELSRIPTIVNLLEGSTWQITDPGLTNMFQKVFVAFEPLIYNGSMMDMVRGRSVAVSATPESEAGGNALTAIRQIAEFAPADVGAALTNFTTSRRLKAGQFHFGNMDRVVAQRSNFAFGVSMSSSRIYNYESINGNNLHGWFTGDGQTYLYVGGGEAQFSGDFWPTVDPYHLPGTTVETNALADAAGQHTLTDQDWVGGAQVAGLYGVAGMSLHPAVTPSTLHGQKSWFMLDNEIVCLGAGISCSDGAGVHTTAENRRLGSPITQSFTLNGMAITPAIGWSTNLPSATPSWCALSGTGGYFFPAGQSNLQVIFTENSGSWSQINTGGDSTTVTTNDYFRLWYNHGVHPTNASYSYVLLPNMTASSVSNYAINPDIFILTNTSAVQAVSKPSLGVVAANFWTAGTNSADIIMVNDKSSVITLQNSNTLFVGVCDPTQTNTGIVRVTLNCAAANIVSSDPALTVVQLAPQIVLSVNVNGANGRSIQASFTLQEPDTDGDGMGDWTELSLGRDPNSPADLGFEFNTDGDFEGWGNPANISNLTVTNGALSGLSGSDPHLSRAGLNFSGSSVSNIVVNLRSSAATTAQLFWTRVGANTFSAGKSASFNYTNVNNWQTCIFAVYTNADWSGQTITALRIDPTTVSNQSFDIDWLRGLNGPVTAPAISGITNQTVPENTPSGPLNFMIGSGWVPASSLEVTGYSSNTNLVPAANLVLNGNGANRMVALTPVLNQTGLTTIQLVVSDGVFTATNSFDFAVTSTNGTAPSLAAISNRVLIAGQTLLFTNVATDNDYPTQALVFSLLNPPAGAGIDSSSGVFNWRPVLAQSSSTNFLSVKVSKNGAPSLSATQSFLVTVKTPALPVLVRPELSAGAFTATVNGDGGPDYIALSSTDLLHWKPFATNFAAAPPFKISVPVTNLYQEFYQIQLGP